MENQPPQQFKVVQMEAADKNRPVTPAAFFNEDGTPRSFGSLDAASVGMIVDAATFTPGTLEASFGVPIPTPVNYRFAVLNSPDESVPDGIYEGQTPLGAEDEEDWASAIQIAELPSALIIGTTLVDDEADIASPTNGEFIYAYWSTDDDWAPRYNSARLLQSIDGNGYVIDGTGGALTDTDSLGEMFGKLEKRIYDLENP